MASKGFFVGGTSGEFVNLRMEEREKLLDAREKLWKRILPYCFNVTAMNEYELYHMIEWGRKKGRRCGLSDGSVLSQI